MDIIPREIICEIFNNINIYDFETQVSIKSTCKLWNEISNDIWVYTDLLMKKLKYESYSRYIPMISKNFDIKEGYYFIYRIYFSHKKEVLEICKKYPNIIYGDKFVILKCALFFNHQEMIDFILTRKSAHRYYMTYKDQVELMRKQPELKSILFFNIIESLTK